MQILSNKAYDILKWIAIVFLDAVGVCYMALANIWGFPYGDHVMATCSALSVFLGTLLGLSTIQYHKNINKAHEEAQFEENLDLLFDDEEKEEENHD